MSVILFFPPPQDYKTYKLICLAVFISSSILAKDMLFSLSSELNFVSIKEKRM